MWKPEIGERLVCKTDDRKEAALYDENAIGVHKQLEAKVDQKPEFILVGQLPMELSFLMYSFLKLCDDNILIAEVILLFMKNAKQKAATIASNSENLADIDVCNQSLISSLIHEKP